MEEAVPMDPIPCLVTSSGALTGPGPGAYNTRSDISQVTKITIHSRPTQKEGEPGAPLRMLPSTIGTGKKYTIGHRPNDSQQEVTPGPCYKPPELGEDLPKTVIGRRTEKIAPEVTPGPSDYDTDKFYQSKNKGISFHGPRDRSTAVQDRSPGPGAYAPSLSNKTSSPRVTIGRRTETKTESFGPGPGAYDTRSGFKVSKYGGVIGTKPTSQSQDITPGPSDYSSDRSLISGIPKLHIGTRPQTKPLSDSPGPYTTRSTFGEGPKYSMRSRPKDSIGDTTPGVDYAPPSFGSGSTKVHISPRFNHRSADVTPGPSDYTTTTGLVNLKKAPRFHGPRDRSGAVPDRSPGPAAYEPIRSPRPVPIRIKGASYSPRTQQSGEYVMLKSTMSGPRYTIAPRCNLQVSFG